MAENKQFFLVDAKALPDVFLKVVQAKSYLAQGKAKNLVQAAQMAGVSRSAFYKYKDSVYPYDERMSGNMLTFYLSLEDRPGVLSNVLGALYKAGMNIVTVSQNIPVDGAAIVSVSVCTGSESLPSGRMLETLRLLDGVVEAKTV